MCAEACWHLHMFALKRVYTCSNTSPLHWERVCTHVHGCLGRDDICCIKPQSLFDLSAFIFSAKKPNILRTLIEVWLLMCLHVYKLSGGTHKRVLSAFG